MTQRGEGTTAEALCALYRRLNEQYFGPDMVVDEEIALEWARIPHFYYDYYVYQYATGYAAAIALSRRILREDESAVSDYRGFRSGGCSADPITLLRGAGVDMASPAPIEDATRLFHERADYGNGAAAVKRLVRGEAGRLPSFFCARGRNTTDDKGGFVMYNTIGQ